MANLQLVVKEGIRERKKRMTHERICDVASRLFIEQGYPNTTIDAILPTSRIGPLQTNDAQRNGIYKFSRTAHTSNSAPLDPPTPDFPSNLPNSKFQHVKGDVGRPGAWRLNLRGM